MRLTCVAAVGFASRRPDGTTTSRVVGLSSTVVSFNFGLSISKFQTTASPIFRLVFCSRMSILSLFADSRDRQIMCRIISETRSDELRRGIGLGQWSMALSIAAQNRLW